MKILAFVDLHGNMDVLENIGKLAKEQDVDYIVCLGDITIFEDNYAKLMKKLDSFGKPVLYLHGNHEGEKTTRKLVNKLKNVKFLHRETHEHKEFLFVGYGGGGFAQKEPDFEKWVKRLDMKGKKIILLTHAPPYNTKLDPIWGESVGVKSYKKFIKKHQPVLALSGHLHDNEGAVDKVGKTELINPGPWEIVIEV